MKSKTNVSRAWRLTAAIVICIVGLWTLLMSQPGYIPKVSAGQGGLDNFIYLPVIQKPIPRGIYGYVTAANSGAVANVPLELRFYNGSAWSTFTSTNTDSDGMYSFTDIPGLQAEQRYYVRYLNTSNEAYLYTWHTLPITTYSTGQEVAAGDFDIANIVLQTPSSGQQVALPATFSWLLRNGVTAESYELNLFDYNDQDPYFFTDPALGYVSHYTLNSLPADFQYNTEYGWNVWVYGPSGNASGDWGISYYYHYISFYNTNYQSTPMTGQMKTADLMSHLADRGIISADLDLGK